MDILNWGALDGYSKLGSSQTDEDDSDNTNEESDNKVNIRKSMMNIYKLRSRSNLVQEKDALKNNDVCENTSRKKDLSDHHMKDPTKDDDKTEIKPSDKACDGIESLGIEKKTCSSSRPGTRVEMAKALWKKMKENKQFRHNKLYKLIKYINEY